MWPFKKKNKNNWENIELTIDGEKVKGITSFQYDDTIKISLEEWNDIEKLKEIGIRNNLKGMDNVFAEIDGEERWYLPHFIDQRIFELCSIERAAEKNSTI